MLVNDSLDSLLFVNHVALPSIAVPVFCYCQFAQQVLPLEDVFILTHYLVSLLMVQARPECKNTFAKHAGRFSNTHTHTYACMHS